MSFELPTQPNPFKALKPSVDARTVKIHYTNHHATMNQDTPLAEGLIPLLVIDVWEDAYYLKYQNRRDCDMASIWSIINWDEVERRFTPI